MKKFSFSQYTVLCRVDYIQLESNATTEQHINMFNNTLNIHYLVNYEPRFTLNLY